MLFIVPLIGRFALMKASWDTQRTEKIYTLDLICMWNHLLYNYLGYFYLFDSIYSYIFFYVIAATLQGFLAWQLMLSHITMPYSTKENAKNMSTLVRQAAC